MIIRNAKEKDVRRIIEIHNTVYRTVSGFTPKSIERFMNWMSHPDISLERDYYVAENGGILGYFGITSRKSERRIGRGNLSGAVHPEHQRKGFGTQLMNFALELSRKRKFKFIDTWVHGELGQSQRFLEKFGFEIVRYFWDMRIENPKIGEIRFPEGIEVRNFVLGEDEQNLLDIYNNSFAEHWGHTDVTLEDIENWKKEKIFDPKGIFLAIHRDKIIGLCVNFIEEVNVLSKLQKIGIVGVLGVHTDYRRKGIGKALLLTGVKYLQKKKMKIVELGVDAENPKAKNLYEGCGFREVRRGMVYRKKL
ncbi:MAG: GNAT family N-acetyltransferase [Candidatus Methanofastidiosia archaeon]